MTPARDRIQPGDLCLIVSETLGCECNIGAFVTVVRRADYENSEPGEWLFKDASRPLKFISSVPEEFGRVIWGLHSDDTEEDCYLHVLDHQLIPIRPLAQEDVTSAHETLSTHL